MLNESLLKAYQETNYCFGEVVLNIGKISEEAQKKNNWQNLLSGSTEKNLIMN